MRKGARPPCDPAQATGVHVASRVGNEWRALPLVAVPPPPALVALGCVSRASTAARSNAPADTGAEGVTRKFIDCLAVDIPGN